MSAGPTLESCPGDCRIALVQPDLQPGSPGCGEALEQVAVKLGLPLLEAGVPPQRDTRCDVYLSRDDSGFYLQLTGPGAPGPVRCGFDDPAMAHRRRGSQNELLGRAVGVQRRAELRVVDCTAGYAADAFVLADLGARVLLCEQHPLLAALLQLSLERLRMTPSDWRHEVALRMSIRPGDARSLPSTTLDRRDVLYLDPMFPSGRRAAAGKGMVLLQSLLRDRAAGSAELLMHWALGQDVWRVVVKRPLKAPLLGDRRPSHSLAGRSVRFDVYQLEGGTDNES